MLPLAIGLLHWFAMDWETRIALIGGSGLYEFGLLESSQPLTLHTPYGQHSDGLRTGAIGGIAACFLPRHGTGHSIPPHRVPYRANLWALRTLGVRKLLTVSAMGGVHPDLRIGDTCVPDQIIDWTRSRDQTFFDGPVVVHTPFVEPFCPRLRSQLLAAAQNSGLPSHDGGTVVVFEGPRFSTKAESMLLRDVFKADLLSMTTMPEAILARELGICYGTLAVVTDLDAFGEDPVSAQEVNEVMRQSRPRIAAIIERTVRSIVSQEQCDACRPVEGSPYG